ncbi:MAG: hypothetical protein NC187_06995 [Candidatus Amulumruptor caecigallinarius]|nr:hypothetical protein [Candidatus Amulumruptor caecigallinarius]MCM1397214.1 hypothetical protein [Candidatus Amulumruptor caecigallinarius]MCM1453097.1 hypothetical protein [bacterium]
MLGYYRKDEFVSFGFVAAPDLGTEKVERPNKRFRFYRSMMLNVFGEKTFVQAYDAQASVYVLINRKSYDAGVLSIEMLEIEISRLYDGDYALSTD